MGFLQARCLSCDRIKTVKTPKEKRKSQKKKKARKSHRFMFGCIQALEWAEDVHNFAVDVWQFEFGVQGQQLWCIMGTVMSIVYIFILEEITTGRKCCFVQAPQYVLLFIISVQSIAASMSVCLSVCLLAYLNMSEFHLWLCLGPPLTAVPYVMYFWFGGWRRVFT